MKRFWVFGSEDYEPYEASPGFHAFVASFDTFDEALAFVLEMKPDDNHVLGSRPTYGWWQIVDSSASDPERAVVDNSDNHPDTREYPPQENRPLGPNEKIIEITRETIMVDGFASLLDSLKFIK